MKVLIEELYRDWEVIAWDSSNTSGFRNDALGDLPGLDYLCFSWGRGLVVIVHAARKWRRETRSSVKSHALSFSLSFLLHSILFYSMFNRPCHRTN